jgi:hypothetical protein
LHILEVQRSKRDWTKQEKGRKEAKINHSQFVAQNSTIRSTVYTIRPRFQNIPDKRANARRSCLSKQHLEARCHAASLQLEATISLPSLHNQFAIFDKLNCILLPAPSFFENAYHLCWAGGRIDISIYLKTGHLFDLSSSSSSNERIDQFHSFLAPLKLPLLPLPSRLCETYI